MKKLLVFIGLMISIGGISRAGFFETTPDYTMTVVYSTSVLTATTSTTTIVIDLSNTTDWPHKNTREINISSVRIEVDKVAASTGTVRLGVVNFVNTSTGSVTWFAEKSLLNNVSNGDNDLYRNYSPNYIRTRVEGGQNITSGLTPYLFSVNRSSGSTSYQSDIVLPTLAGTFVAPGRGDVIVEISKTSLSPWTVNIEIQYHTPETR